jgi:hypothetical protein
MQKKDSNPIIPRLAACLTLIALPALYFFPAVLGKVTLAPGDGWTQILGIRILIGQMIRSGQLPLWNPYIFAGTPLLASIQPAALYPPTWLFAVFSPQAAMNIMVITTYHLALIGTYLYARRIGLNRIGSMIAGISFAFGGYMIAHLGHTNRIAAAAWLPWVLLAIEELYLNARWRWVALGAVFVALQFFAGEPQMTFYSALVAGAYGLFSLTLRPSQERRGRFLAAAIAMAMCGALLSMIQLLPENELLKLGDRAKLDYHYFSEFSFPPRQVLNLLIPYFFGGAALPPYRVEYWGRWSPTETCGYVGMMAWLLAIAAVIAQITRRSRERLVWFWVVCALAALILSFGDYLPYEINQYLYRVPVYNLFRASGRHLIEYTFAMGILAGIGVNSLCAMDRKAAGRVVAASGAIMTALVAGAVIIYRFFDERLVAVTPLPDKAGSLANPDLYVPVVFFVLSLGAFLVFIRNRSSLAGCVLALFLFLDLMSFGFFYEWRLIDFNLAERMADPPTVKLIKDREPDLNSFRVLSRSAKPYDRNYEMLDFPNISIARGLQSVNGYDPVRILRMAAIAGNMGLEGLVADTNALNLTDQGFNLLNVKYLLSERSKSKPSDPVNEVEGIRFGASPLNFKLERGVKAEIACNATASELVIVSAMGNSTGLANDIPVVGLKLRARDGGVIEREIRAGRDTSEWAYDRNDVRAIVKHNRARIAETWDAGGFQGHRYLARLPFDRAEITQIEFEYLAPEGDVNISGAALYDSNTGTSVPLSDVELPAERWRRLAQFGEVEVYENLKALPRAWFVGRIAVMPSVEVLKTIRTGRMKDGEPFDPAKVVLLESEIFGDRKLDLPASGPTDSETPGGEIKVTQYQPQRIELTTQTSQSGFLVLSEIYYRGWEAMIDGQRAPVERVDFTLRGIIIPAGNHRVEFFFNHPTFRAGSAYSALGAILLVAGWVVKSRSGRKRGA